MSEKKEVIKIVPPHKTVSRAVLPNDIERVYNDAKKMYELFGTRVGNYESFYAVAHMQITKEDPLRFFVCNPSYAIFDDMPEAVIINPRIIRHTKHTVEKEEGCLSYAKLPVVRVERWHKCEVEFQVLTDKIEMSDVYTKNLSGTLAQVWQHELEHFEGNYIYNVNK